MKIESKEKLLLSVIIPSYNEGRTICKVLEKSLQVEFHDRVALQLIVIDDCSSDNTEKLVRSFKQSHSLTNSQLMYRKLDRNRGKGYAVRQGIEMSTGDFIVIQDADLEYDPNDWPSLIKPLLDGECKVVYGSRILGKNAYSYRSYYYGGRFISWVTTFLFGTLITDEPTCYKMFDARLLKSIPLKVNRFGFCPEVTSKILARGYKIKELPIRYSPRSRDEGKKIKWKDGIEAILILLKYSLFEEKQIDNQKKTVSAYASSALRAVMVLAVLVILIGSVLTTEKAEKYRWISAVLSENSKVAKDYQNLSDEDKLYFKLGYDFTLIDNVKKVTPPNSVLLWPTSEQFEKDRKFQHAISNRVWLTRFLYPRRVVFGNETMSSYAGRITHVLIVNGEVAGNVPLPLPEGQELPKFSVVPVASY